MPTFTWWPTAGGLLNLAKPAQNLYFFWQFKKFKKSATEYSFKLFMYFSHFGENSLSAKFFTSKFCYLLFYNPTHKTETGTAINKWGTINSKPPGPIVMMGHSSETLSTSLIIFITLFSAGAQHWFGFYQPPQIVQLWWPKTIFLSQTGICWLFFIQF